MKKIFILTFLSLLPLFGFTYDKCCEPCKAEPTPCSEENLFAKDMCAYVGNAEFLYWSTQESNLTYAISENNPSWPVIASYASGDYKIAKFDYDPGFRINAGYFNAPKYYHAYGQYTYVRNKNSDSTDAPPQADLYLDGTWPYLFNDSLARATSNIKLDLDLGDLITNRYFFPNPHLRLGMLGGITGGRIAQTWKIGYTSTTGYESLLKHKWKFTGIGLRLGLDVDWFWFSDIYLTTKATLAGLMGKYKNSSKQTTTSSQFGRDPSIPGRDSKYDDYRMIENLQCQFGPSWQKSWRYCRTELFLGYEFNSWLNLHEVFYSGESVPGGGKSTINMNSMLTMHGLDLRFRVDY